MVTISRVSSVVSTVYACQHISSVSMRCCANDDVKPQCGAPRMPLNGGYLGEAGVHVCSSSRVIDLGQVLEDHTSGKLLPLSCLVGGGGGGPSCV